MNNSHVRPVKIFCAVITVSTSRRPDNDGSGTAIREILKAGALPVVHYAIAPDSIDAIRNELFLALKMANCVIINGGPVLPTMTAPLRPFTLCLRKKLMVLERYSA